MGFSLGTGVANYVSSKKDIDRLILLAPYANGCDLYNNVLDIFHGALEVIVSYKMEAIEFAKDVKVRPTIIISTSDTVVPNSSSIRLSKAYPKGSDLIFVHEVSHNSITETAEVMEVLGQ